MPKVDAYDRHADRYEAWFDGNATAYRSELRAVSLMLPGSGAGIEIGVGTGRFAFPLGIPVGVEPSKSMGKIARAKGVAVVGGVGEALPFGDLLYDFALMVTILCFLDDVEKSFLEAYRILKPGGCLVVGFIDRDSPLGRTYEERKGESLFYGNADFLSAAEVARYLEDTGFRSLAFSQTIFDDPGGMDGLDPVRKGHGEGCFVVVRADK